MVLLLFAVFVGCIVAFTTTGSLNSMAAENVQLAVDIENSMANVANALGTNTITLLPIVLVVAILLFVVAITCMTQSFGASYDAGGD